MTNIKLLVLDIDGTISGISNNINPRVKQAIQKVQNKGIYVALATGRMYRSALRFYQDISSKMPLIVYNGAWIQSPQNGKIYYHIPVPKKIAGELLAYSKRPEFLEKVQVNFYINDRLYVDIMNENTKAYVERSNVQAIAVKDLNSLLKVDPTKVLAMCNDPNLIKILAENLQQIYTEEELYLTQSTTNFLEAIHPSVNKGIAVQYLTEKILNFKREEIMAIGDNLNDLTMLEYAGFSIAMGNAPQPVKNIADWVTVDVENDGAAVAIEKFLL